MNAEGTKKIKIGDILEIVRKGIYEVSRGRVLKKKIIELEHNSDGSVKWFRTVDRSRFWLNYDEVGFCCSISRVGGKARYEFADTYI